LERAFDFEFGAENVEARFRWWNLFELGSRGSFACAWRTSCNAY